MALVTDYFKRQIELLAAAIASAMGKGGYGPDQEAADELDAAISAGTGLHTALLVRLDPSSVVTLVGTERANLVADALEARAWVVGPDEMAKSLAAAKRLRRRLEREAPAVDPR